MNRRGRPKHPDILTPRQWEVLALLREGLTNEAIAQRLGVSPDGAKFHVSEILGKLGVTSREEAARWRPEDRPWWAAAAAPFLFWRKLSSGWLAATIVGGLAVGIATGVGLLIWGLARTQAGPASGQPGALAHTFLSPDAEESDYFGKSVALVGNDVLVAAPQGDAGARDSGAAYLFAAGSGDLLQTFLNPNPRENDQFGWSVAAAGDMVVVGARFADIEETNTVGAVYLFDRASGDLLRTLHNPSPERDDQFGHSVAALGDNVLVGAPGVFSEEPLSVGEAYLFDAGSGSLLQTFVNPGPEAGTLFGKSVALVGNDVLVAAPQGDAGARDSGAAYLFDAGSGDLLQTFLNPNPDGDVGFGSSVAAIGDKAVVGAPRPLAATSS
ncbi:MAG: LuxR C-terminal-related transcriptional regulator [Dehalococcoidia bacterium]